MRQTFSLGDPARVARRHNLRRRIARRPVPFSAASGLAKPNAGPTQAEDMEWLAPLDDEETKVLRAAWSFVE
ncbi:MULTISPECIES: hypothetical protein [unclassified Methylobacterium]|jgi:hypothetical protein|uniref:hypothetical protein n=1 Tax=unclassified Methylobacterium TaxID=2615210 RepID=UPI00370025CE